MWRAQSGNRLHPTTKRVEHYYRYRGYQLPECTIGSFWHIDACNPFQIWKWYSENLSPDHWLRVAKGEEPSPYIPVETVDFIWGRLSSYNITVSPGTLSMQAPLFDVLEEVGKKNRVRELFRVDGFEDPYEFREGILDIDIAEANIPL